MDFYLVAAIMVIVLAQFYQVFVKGTNIFVTVLTAICGGYVGTVLWGWPWWQGIALMTITDVSVWYIAAKTRNRDRGRA